ncbi:MAG: alkaline phosphatase family protein [Saprospiraceae bacterium]|nr:alkaline phosphatase family protein [Saprospiraceae bacterium]
MKTTGFIFFLIFLVIGFNACFNKTALNNQNREFKVTSNTYRIAFGSCSKQTKSQKILNTVLQYKPDLFIYLGDNIYGDTRDMDVLRSKYEKLGKKPEFKRLRYSTRILAVWDDHDFGENDAGKEYPFKEESKEIFLEFWREPLNSDRRKHKGIYHVEWVKNLTKKIQIILLDTRTFRDHLTLKTDSLNYKNDYQPTISPDSTMLGKEQWNWLEKQFRQKADLRIIASSNQFSHEYNGWESWTNMPHERQKMLNLIEKTRAEGVVFLSGDVHWGEISKEPRTDSRYPIYDITSSGLTQDWDSTEPNKNRIGKVVRKNNFGLLEINVGRNTFITFKIINKSNVVEVEHKIQLSDLTF